MHFDHASIATDDATGLADLYIDLFDTQLGSIPNRGR
jgi:hypothetical protein